MSVTYYVALPFVKTEDGVAPDATQEMPNEGGDTTGRVDVAGSCQRLRACVQAQRRSEHRQFRRRHNSQSVQRGACELGRIMKP
jgi:hypothetical protein